MKHSLTRRLTVALLLALSLLAGLLALPATALDDGLTAWDGTVAAAFEGGSGTEADPYLIADGAQLAYLSELVAAGAGDYATACYALTSDILLNDLAAVANWKTTAPANAWSPIGPNAAHPFSGRFDGRGHTIAGLYIKSTVAREYTGLFGYTLDAEISDLHLGDGYMFAVLMLGSVVGEAHTTTLSGVHNDGVTVEGVKTRDHVHETIHCVVGGLVGRAYEGCRIESSSVSANVSANNSSNTSSSKTLRAYAGGIAAITVGTQASPVVIRDCSVTGSVYASNNHDYQTSDCGGVVGNAAYTIASGCVIEGGRIEAASTGNSYSGGVFAEATNGQAISCIVASDVLTSNGNKTACSGGGIVASFGNGASLNSFGNRVENCIVTATVTKHNASYTRFGVLAGNIGNNSYIAYNFYVPAEEGDNVVTDVYGAKGSSGVTVTENFTVTAEQLAGTSSAAIAAESTYADTPSVMIAMNRFVKAYNRSDTVTLDQGETHPVVYRYYTMHKGVTFVGTEHGSATFAVMENPFPAASGVTPEGGAVGGLFGFTVEANPGYVLRSVTYVYEGISTTTLQPDAASRYSFVLPAVDVTVQLNFVEEGADVFSITYLDCEEVSVWSDYNPRAHFKGYETPIPTPTRPNYHFRGWVVNGAGPAVMNLTLGADDYSANITLTATWEAKELVALSFDTQTPTYNGEPQAFALSGASAGLPGIVVTYEIDDVFGAELPVNAGTYRVRIYRAEDATYQELDRIVTLRIELAPSSVVIPASISCAYNNAPMPEPAVETVGDGVVSYHWYNRGSDQELADAPRVVGLYTLVVEISQGENYAAALTSQDFEISRATLDATTFGWNYTEAFEYCGQPMTVSIIGLPADVTVVYGGTRTATNAGTYTASATFEIDLTNYYPVTIDDLTWTIDRAVIDDMTLRWVFSDFVYDGTQKSVTLQGLPADVTVTVTGNTATNAGAYTATAQFDYDSANYASVSVEPLNWTIRRATIPAGSITWNVPDFVFDGTRKTVTVTGVPASLTPRYSGNSYIAAGTYRAVVSFEGDFSNYEPVLPMTVEWTIARAETVITGPVYQTAIYDGTPKAPQATLNHGEAAVICLEDLPTEKGVYNITLYVPASPNYNEATRVVRLTISAGDDAVIDEMLAHISAGYYSGSLSTCRTELNAAYDCYRLLSDKNTDRAREAIEMFGFLVEYYNQEVARVNRQMSDANRMTLTVVHRLMPNVVVRRFATQIVELYE